MHGLLTLFSYESKNMSKKINKDFNNINTLFDVELYDRVINNSSFHALPKLSKYKPEKPLYRANESNKSFSGPVIGIIVTIAIILFIYFLSTGQIGNEPNLNNSISQNSFGNSIASSLTSTDSTKFSADSIKILGPVILNHFTYSNAYPYSYRFSTDGKYILVSSGYREFSVMNTESNEIVGKYSKFKDWITNLSFSPDGRFILASDKSGKLRILSSIDFSDLQSFEGCYFVNQSISFSPDGRYFAFQNLSNIFLYKVIPEQNPFKMIAVNDSITSITFSNKSLLMASTSNIGSIDIIDLESGRRLPSMVGHLFKVNCASFSLNDSLLVSAGEDETIKLWEVSSSKLIKSWYAHNSEITAITLSPDNKYIVSGAVDDSIKVWTFPDGKFVTGFSRNHVGGIRTLNFSPDQKILFYEDWSGYFEKLNFNLQPDSLNNSKYNY